MTHRIADTQKVLATAIPPFSTGLRMIKMFAIMFLILFVATASSMIIHHFIGRPAKINFLIPQKTGQNIEVKIQPLLDGRIRVRSVDDKTIRETVSIEKFFATKGLTPKLVSSKENRLWFIYMFVAFCFVIPMCWKEYWRERRRNRLRKLLGLSEKGTKGTQPEVGQVSSEAAPSAPPDEPST